MEQAVVIANEQEFGEHGQRVRVADAQARGRYHRRQIVDQVRHRGPARGERDVRKAHGEACGREGRLDVRGPAIRPALGVAQERRERSRAKGRPARVAANA
jgi:hypothetical protein